MGNRWKKVRKQAATFGVAMSAIAGAEIAEGAVVSLTPNPGTVPWSTYRSVSLGVSGLSFLAVNATVYKAFGNAGFGSLSSFRGTTAGNLITTGLSFKSVYTAVPSSASGTQTFAFKTASNNLGWIRIHFGGTGGADTDLAAAYETTAGAPIVAGAVPEPGAGALFGLGLLALGAVGVKKRRRRTEAAS